MKSYLENQAIQQKIKIELLQKQLTLIESTIEHLDCQSSIPEYSIALKDFPKHDVVSYRQTIAAPNRESVLWWGLANAVQSLNIQYSSPNLNIAIFHDEGFVEENLDVEIQKSVARKYPDTGIAKFKTIEPFTAATLTYKGHYVKLPEVYEAMARWIADNHYKIAGPHFNIYHVSPETQEAFEDMITEVCFPVEPVLNAIDSGIMQELIINSNTQEETNNDKNTTSNGRLSLSGQWPMRYLRMENRRQNPGGTAFFRPSRIPDDFTKKSDSA